MHIEDSLAIEIGNMNNVTHEQQLAWNTTKNSKFLFSRKISLKYKNYRDDLLILSKSLFIKEKLIFLIQLSKTGMKINIKIHYKDKHQWENYANIIPQFKFNK